MGESSAVRLLCELRLATTHVLRLAEVQRPGGPQNSCRPEPWSAGRRTDTGGFLRSGRPVRAWKPWGSVGVRNTTPGVRHCGGIPDVLNNNSEIRWS